MLLLVCGMRIIISAALGVHRGSRVHGDSDLNPCLIKRARYLLGYTEFCTHTQD